MNTNYETFDFEGNAKFQEYFADLYPVPTDIEKYKRKWYQKYIESNIDADKDAQPKQEQKQEIPKPQPEPQAQPKQQVPQQPPKPTLPLLYVIEGVLKVLYFPILLFMIIPEYAKWVNCLSLLICFMGLYRMVGKPQFNQAYLQKVLPNEFASNIMYTVVLFSVGSSFAFQVPLALHYLSGAAEFWSRLSQEESYVLKAAGYIRSNRNVIITTKQKIELYLFVYALIGIFIGKGSFFTALLLFQNIALKNKVNPNMQTAQGQIRVWYCNTLSENTKIPAGVRNVLKMVWKGYEKLISLV